MSGVEAAHSRIAAAEPQRAGPDQLGTLDAAVNRRTAIAASTPASAEGRDWRPSHAPVSSPSLQAAGTRVATSAISQPDAATLARLAQAVYLEAAVLPSGWREATSADMQAIGVRPADLDSPRSAFRAKVYATGTGIDQRFVVAFRGSTTDRGDWITNGRQAAGLASDHYAAALKVGSLVGASGHPNVTLTGHSLGGGLASAAALAAGHDAVTFNAAGLSDRTIADAQRLARGNGTARMPDIRAYHVRGEILSAIQDGGDRMLGALLGGAIGRRIADAPEAYGTRTTLGAVRAEGTPWWRDTPVARHGMDYVLRGLDAGADGRTLTPR